MIRYFSGDDTFTARRRITALATEMQAQLRFVDEEGIAHSSVEQIFDGSNGGLFGKTFLVLLDVSTYSERIRDQIVVMCKSPERYDALLWDRIAPDRRSSFYKTLQKSIESESFSRISEKNKAHVWVAEYAYELTGDKKSLEAGAIETLLQQVGYDTWALSQEVQKLLAYHVPVTKEDVITIVPERETSMDSAFPLLDAIVAKRQKSAMDVLQRMVDSGSAERFIISMLAYQFRLFLAVRMGIDTNEGVAAIAQKSGLHPVAIQKAMPIVRRLSVSMIHDILSRIAMTERSMNTKSMDARSMLTMLVMGLSG